MFDNFLCFIGIHVWSMWEDTGEGSDYWTRNEYIIQNRRCSSCGKLSRRKAYA